jgi:DNA-binding FadR family transcriptional regulator
MVRRTSTAEAIVEHLLERIRGGDIGPGDRLPSERDLQAQLGVGRVSLREALARLSALGIIRVDHGKGAFLQEGISTKAVANTLVPLFPERNAKNFYDLVDARSLIEGEMAARAAHLRTDADIERLREIIAEIRAGAEGAEALAELDFSFHRELARIADSEFLRVMLDALAEQIRTYLVRYVRARPDPKSLAKRHQPILRAIADRDAERARKSVRKHIDVSKSSLQAYLNGGNGK